MHNRLMCQPINRTVIKIDDVNRYDYSAPGLIIPYVLANAFTLVTIIVGLWSYVHHGVLPEKAFTDIACASRDSGIVHRDEEVAERDAQRHALRHPESVPAPGAGPLASV
jgi:hypothetical protein